MDTKNKYFVKDLPLIIHVQFGFINTLIVSEKKIHLNNFRFYLIFGVLTPLSTIFQLYHDDHF